MARIELQAFHRCSEAVCVIRATPQYSPVDLNIPLLFQHGYSAADRFRLLKGRTHDPCLVLRKYDRSEKVVVALQIRLDAVITAFTNDESYGCRFIKDLLLNGPPSFRQEAELKLEVKWSSCDRDRAFFLGMIRGASDWAQADTIFNSDAPSVSHVRPSDAQRIC